MVGGGVSGLVAARTLAARHAVVLVEASATTGGKLVTGELRGRRLDLGPDSFLTRGGVAQGLCRELGLEAELAPPATAGAAVLARHKVRPLPAGLVLGIPTDLASLLRSGVVGPLSVLRAAADLLLPATRTREGDDPTIAEVVGPRLGRAVLETLVDPLLGGINAGDSRALSFAATAPALAGAVAGKRSLVAALRTTRPAAHERDGRSTRATTFGAPASSQAEHPGEPPAPARAAVPPFLGLRDGIGTLAERLADDCTRRGVEIRTATRADMLVRGTGDPGLRWVLGCGDETIEADGVVLAVPAPAAGALVAGLDATLAAECRAITYADVVTVALAWPDSTVPLAILRTAGSGILVPRPSGRLVTAVSYTSGKWPGAARAGETVLRVSVGRDGDSRPASLDDDALVLQVRAELSSMLGITAGPLATLVRRWPASLPQYRSGHLDRVRRIEQRVAALDAVAVAGAAYAGIGIPACITSGQRAAASVEAQLDP